MTQYFVPAIRRATVERARLLPRATDESAPLTVVHGSAGSGKSTLLTQYSAHFAAAGNTVVWISLNSDDSGRNQLWTRIVETMRRAEAWDESFPFSSFLPSELSDANLVTELRRGFEDLPRPTILVLDDYHHVADPAADATLAQLAHDVGTLRFLVGTRVAGLLTSAENAASTPLALVEAESIEFSVDDTADLLELAGLGKNTTLAQEIRSATHGWPLATHALVIEAQRGEISVDKRLAMPQRSRFLRNLVRTRLTRATPELREFILKTSLADEATLALAIRLTDRDTDSAQRFFDDLELDGVGTWQFRDGEEVFRFHPLLREALEKAAEVQLPALEIRRLRTMLADSLGISRPGRALELALQLQDWERMDAVLRKQFPLISATRRESTLKVLERVPASVAREYSSILGARTILEYGQPASSSARLRRALAFVLDGTPGKAPRDLLTDAGLRMAAARLMGHGAKALALANVTLQRIEDASESELEHDELVLPTLLNQSAITLIYEGQFDRALQVLGGGHALAVRIGLRREPLHAQALTALAQALLGDMVSARETIALCEEQDSPSGWRDGYLGAGYRIAKALCFLDDQEPDRALAELAVLAPHEPTIEHWPYLAVVEAWAILQRDGAEQAYAALRTVIARKRWRLQPVEGLRALLIAAQAGLLVTAGQTLRAQKLLSSDHRGTYPISDLAHARLLLSRGEADAAFALATDVAWTTQGSPRLQSEALLVKATAAHQIERSDLATAALQHAFSTLTQHQLRLPLLSVPLGALRAIAGRDANTDTAILAGLPDVFHHIPLAATLSPAELRVLRALAGNPDTAAISAALHLSTNTVRSHLKSIYRKLGVNSRRDAITLAADLGLLADSRSGTDA